MVCDVIVFGKSRSIFSTAMKKMRMMRKSKLLMMVVATSFQAATVYGQTSGTVTDVEGNSYRTVKIGGVWWMAENLKTRHYQNGDTISIYPETYTSKTTGEPVTGGASYDYCVHYTYPNDSVGAYHTYGLNYTWSAVFDDRAICPTGWEVPDSADWYNLAKAVTADKSVGAYSSSGYTEVGKYLKSDSLWASDASITTDDSYSFGAVPSGSFSSTGYVSFGDAAYFWTEHEVDPGKAGRYYMALKYNSNDLVLSSFRNNNTCCVRCIQSAVTALSETQESDAIKVSVDQEMGLARLISYVGSEWSLYNISGIKVSSGKTTDEISFIDLDSFPTGVYVLLVKKDNLNKPFKIMKK